MKTKLFRLLTALIVLAFNNSQANPWALVTEPLQIGENAQSIGSYTAGCVSGAVALPINGLGYQAMRLSRNRLYGHPNLKKFIENLGQTIAAQGLGTLLVGDLGQARGGPALSGHRSHQTGLDVDIWFLLSEQAQHRFLTVNERESWSAPSVLSDGSSSLDYRQWSRANERVLEAAARMPEVDRIFVNPSVKRELCLSAERRDWLRKIRPWWKHDDHFHVRLKCPTDSPYCVNQEPLPAGEGCDAGLAWWFSDEATKPATKPAPYQAPELPKLCSALLENR